MTADTVRRAPSTPWAAHWKRSTSTSLFRPAVTDDDDAVLLRASISGREA